jgi:hypothetical protein
MSRRETGRPGSGRTPRASFAAFGLGRGDDRVLKGVGPGLPLSKRMAEGHGRTCFVLRLPAFAPS